ncbi:MAG: hypothetical protein JNK82_02980 [Myxococcaceae bacterium]|nr:hypothetical protein [Myxococcaceae bacterium]
MLWALVTLATAAPQISAPALPLGAPLTNSGNYFREPLPQVTPSIAPGNLAGSYYVVWVDLREREGAAVWGAALTGSGPSIDVSANRLGTELSLPQPGVFTSPVVATYSGAAPSQRGHLVVWENPLNGTIFGRRVAFGGAPIDAAPFSLMVGGRAPSLACLGDRCFVAWLDANGVSGRSLTAQTDGGFLADVFQFQNQAVRWVALTASRELEGFAAAVMTAGPGDAGVVSVVYLTDGGPSTVMAGTGADLGIPPVVAHGDAGTAVAWVGAMPGNVVPTVMVAFVEPTGVRSSQAPIAGSERALAAALT